LPTESAPSAQTAAAAPPAISFESLWARYWREFARHQKSRRDKDRIGKLLVKFFGARAAIEMTTADCEDYRDWRRRRQTRLGDVAQPGTLNRELSVLRHVFNWAVRGQILKYSPLTALEMEREDNVRKTKVRGEAELQLILAELSPLYRALTLVLIDSGLRRMEAIALRWPSLDTKRGIIELFETKNDEPRRPRLSARALAAVLALPRHGQFVFASERKRDHGRHVNPTTALRHLQAACDRAGVAPAIGENWTLHALRHSFAYLRRVRDRIPEKSVMLQGGWKTRAAFDRYGIGDDTETEEMYRVIDANIAADERTLAATKESRRLARRAPEDAEESRRKSK